MRRPPQGPPHRQVWIRCRPAALGTGVCARVRGGGGGDPPTRRRCAGSLGGRSGPAVPPSPVSCASAGRRAGPGPAGREPRKRVALARRGRLVRGCTVRRVGADGVRRRVAYSAGDAAAAAVRVRRLREGEGGRVLRRFLVAPAPAPAPAPAGVAAAREARRPHPLPPRHSPPPPPACPARPALSALPAAESGTPRPRPGAEFKVARCRRGVCLPRRAAARRLLLWAGGERGSVAATRGLQAYAPPRHRATLPVDCRPQRPFPGWGPATRGRLQERRGGP